MTDLLVLTFDDPEEAAKVRETFMKLHHERNLEVVDSVIVVTDADGKPKLAGDSASGAKKLGKRGAIVGGLLAVALPGVGLLLGAAAGLAMGALAGGSLGAATIDKKFVKEVTDAMKPGTSALFLVIKGGTAGVLSSALRPYEGRIYQTSLPEDVEESMQKALE